MENIEKKVSMLQEEELISDRKVKVRSKKTLTGQYYASLLRKEVIKCLLVIGAILGCIISISLVVQRSVSWWWIPLSTLFIGPIGLVFVALILPLIPWILYILLRVLIAVNS